MEFHELQIDRSSVRDEVFAVLQSMKFASYADPPGMDARNIEDLTGRGRSLDAFLIEVFKQLDTSGKIRKVSHAVSSSTTQRTLQIYYHLYIQGLIFEEVMSLVREGIIMLARIVPDGLHWTGMFTVDPNHIIVTAYGTAVLADHQSLPYFANDYIKLLAQTLEPDDELKGYLSEGLACVHNNLPRAAILLLRLPCEHILQKLIQVIETKISDEKRSNEFRAKVNKASTNLARRANVVFDQLESDPALIASNAHLKDRLLNELKPNFHTIREVAGNAAHRNVPIDREQVRYFYGAFASVIYPIAMQIVLKLQAAE